MKRFLKHIALFSIPLTGLLIYLISGPYDMEYGYRMIQKDCYSGSWIHQRLYENPRDIDVAFVGTSRTLVGVNDSLIEKRLKDEYRMEVKTANLGVCREGINMHYVMVRELLEHHSPEYIVLEIQPHLKSGSHIHFPYLARPAEVLASPLVVNNSYFSDIAEFTRIRWIFHREKWLGIHHEYYWGRSNPDHGFFWFDYVEPADSASLEAYRQKYQHMAVHPPEGGLKKVAYDLDMQVPRTWLSRIQRLTEAAGTEIIFLYLPPYGAGTARPRELDIIAPMGRVWTPPAAMLNDPALRMDHEHFNQAGAQRLSEWLAGQIADLSRESK